MNQKITIAPVLEISSAILTNNLSSEEAEQLLASPKSFIYSKLDVDVQDLDILVAENNHDEVHLALPYYSQIEVVHAQLLKDNHLIDVSGGELLVSLGVFAGVMIGNISGTLSTFLVGGIIGGAIGAIALTGVVAGTTAGIRAKKNQNIDGTEK